MEKLLNLLRFYHGYFLSYNYRVTSGKLIRWWKDVEASIVINTGLEITHSDCQGVLCCGALWYVPITKFSFPHKGGPVPEGNCCAPSRGKVKACYHYPAVPSTVGLSHPQLGCPNYILILERRSRPVITILQSHPQLGCPIHSWAVPTTYSS